MSYATRSDMEVSFGATEVAALLDRDRDGSEDAGLLAEALAFADDHIDGYLRERYTLPLANVPQNLVGVACDIARYRLYQDQPTELVQNRYDVGCFLLKDIARGLVSLNVGAATTEHRIAYSTPTTIFTRMEWDD